MSNTSENFTYGSHYRVAFVLLFAVGFAAFVDQWTKKLAFNSSFGEFLNVFKPYAGKVIFLNANFAFSLPLPQWLMYASYGVVLVVIALYLVRHFNVLTTLHSAAWGLVLGGALSNVGERVVNGHVRDFVQISNGIFNGADFFIILGMLLLISTKSYPPAGGGHSKSEQENLQ